MNGCGHPDELSALVDGECPPERRRELHEHLRACEPCRRTLERYTTIRLQVAALPRLTAPQDFVAALLASPPGSRWWQTAVRGPRKYVLAAAAAVVIAVSAAGIAVPPEAETPPVDVMVIRHATVNAGGDVGGQIHFAVSRP